MYKKLVQQLISDEDFRLNVFENQDSHSLINDFINLFSNELSSGDLALLNEYHEHVSTFTGIQKTGLPLTKQPELKLFYTKLSQEGQKKVDEFFQSIDKITKYYITSTSMEPYSILNFNDSPKPYLKNDCIIFSTLESARFNSSDWEDVFNEVREYRTYSFLSKIAQNHQINVPQNIQDKLKNFSKSSDYSKKEDYLNLREKIKKKFNIEQRWFKKTFFGKDFEKTRFDTVNKLTEMFSGRPDLLDKLPNITITYAYNLPLISGRAFKKSIMLDDIASLEHEMIHVLDYADGKLDGYLVGMTNTEKNQLNQYFKDVKQIYENAVETNTATERIFSDEQVFSRLETIKKTDQDLVNKAIKPISSYAFDNSVYPGIFKGKIEFSAEAGENLFNKTKAEELKKLNSGLYGLYSNYFKYNLAS